MCIRDSHPAFDLNGDGIADSVFRPNDLMDHILWSQPAAKLLTGSPAVQLVRWSQSSFPAILPGGVTDSHPLMHPHDIPVPADIAGSLGTDFTFAIERPSLPIPGWVASVEVVRPAVLDSAITAITPTVAGAPSGPVTERTTLSSVISAAVASEMHNANAGVGAADVVACGYRYTDPMLNDTGWEHTPTDGDATLDGLCELNQFALGGLVFRRQVLRGLCERTRTGEPSLFSTRTHHEDWELLLRLTAAGAAWTSD